MSELFAAKMPKLEKPEDPKRVRMPTSQSPTVQSAVNRARSTSATRTGRASTILTSVTPGSTGQTLGR